ncbi:MAG: hypothetical protein H6810_02965 [Phycisphaeraceae bacterium]|nr:MAG: hypothetical protein H6810_02965 [Phycisphaeraceae bacterium]
MLSKSIALTAIAAAAGLASAGVIASYSYTDLAGSYDVQSSTFSAAATDNGTLFTGGDVSLLTGPKGTAQFDTGFFGAGVANVSIIMSVSNITSTSADGVGQVVLTDLDGDTLSADFFGSWNIFNPIGFMFFSGATENYVFTDNGDQDGFFDGTTGGFSMAGLLGNTYEGAISLLLQSPGSFSHNFARVSTEGDGLLIPAPSVLALAGLGLMTSARRRN